jgi:hypothetical protein
VTHRYDSAAGDSSRPRRRSGPRRVSDLAPRTLPSRSMGAPIEGQPAPRWSLEPFVADDGTIPFERFIDELPDFQFIALATAIERVLAVRGIELARTEWLKSLGEGLHEFRVRHDGAEISRMFGGHPPSTALPAGQVLLRVFVHFYGDRTILLLGGYDKGRSPKERQQQREIGKARRLLSQFKTQQRREKRRR